MNNILKISLLIGCFYLFSCNIHTENTKKTENLEERKLLKQKESLKNMKINSLNKILGDSIDVTNIIIMIYNEFDCGSCISNGFNAVKLIDSISNCQSCYIITSSVNIGKDQLFNEYGNYIFYDEHDLIRKELKYIYTPVLFKISTSNVISDVLFPVSENDLTKIEKFLE